jgi:hypothetical protein
MTMTMMTIPQGVGVGGCAVEEAVGILRAPPPQRWGGGAPRLSNRLIPLPSSSPPIAQEEVDGNDDHLRAIVHNYIHNREYGMRALWVSVIFKR